MNTGSESDAVAPGVKRHGNIVPRRQGRDFSVSPFRVQKGAHYVKAVSRTGELVAIGEIRLPNVYHPILVL